MLRKDCKTKEEAQIYLAGQKIRMEKGYLTRSEREELKPYLEKPELLVKKEIEIIKGKSIVTNIKELRKPCLPVEQEEDVSQIIKDLKETFNYVGGWGITSNQIGYNKKISYIKVPTKVDQKTREITYTELILINAKIIEKNTPIQVKNEACLSFSGIFIDTKRYVYITLEYLDEKLNQKIAMFQDTEALCVAHETDHQNGLTIFDRKWKAQ